ncbi:hypothetical protein KOW79_012859 [Hemibagrus wyckioides]|uniref:Uncharacterized protein n=1 Tax=Hemibagrus wyckioides TaxID=337641 RepID=A0A9D3NJ12_9TELE|nr:uncharacterized protein LOC131365568 [Hemibagrus wyckioides]KAG7323157.1 hypothetical protein KOW79_012859 [Hemibagrus wyckioides]
MAGIVSKSKAKGVDFCGVSDNYLIVRSDLGCYLYSTNFHQGLGLTVYSLHPSCQGGDHYLAYDDSTFYIIKGNSYRRVSDMSKDLDAEVNELHKNCQGGDNYLSAYGKFYIIFKDRGVYRRTTDMSKDSDAVEYPLHPNCKDGLYYWGTKQYSYFLKPKGEWGIQYHKTDNLNKDTYASTYSVHPDVLNFLPGGLAITQGPAFGKWELIKTISNDSETPLHWQKKITQKVGYTKSKSSSIEHNWKISMSTTYQSGILTEGISKYQFSLSAEYGGQSVNTEEESWEEATETEESLDLTLQPHTKMFIWQYKLGFGKKDVLFCRDLIFDDDPNPPSTIPLPAADHSGC